MSVRGPLEASRTDLKLQPGSAGARRGFQTTLTLRIHPHFSVRPSSLWLRLTSCSLWCFTVTLLSSCEAFRWDSAKLLQYEGSAQDQIIQDSAPFKSGQRLYRSKRHRELVRTQPHLVHNMAVPEIEESSRSNARVNLSQLKMASTVGQDRVRTHVEDSRKVEDEMEVKTRRY